MATSLAQRSLEEIVAEQGRRLTRVERARRQKYRELDDALIAADGIVLGEGANETPVLSLTVPPPTALNGTPGARFSEIFVDLAWTPPADVSQIAGYELTVRRVVNPGVGETYDVDDVKALPKVSSHRVRSLEPNTTYDFVLASRDRLGRVSTSVTTRETTGADTTSPGTPVAPTVTGGATTIVVQWTEVADADVANGNGVYEIQVDRKLGAGGAWATVRSTREGGRIVGFADLDRDDGAVAPATPVLYYYRARVRAIDASGNAGAWSPYSTDTTMGADQAGVISTDELVAYGIAAYAITFGEMSGDRISVNTLDAGRIKASSLLVDVELTTGRLKVGTGPGATGLYMDSAGIRLYNGATRTVYLDAATGTLTLAGTVTASGATITGDVNVAGTFTLTDASASFRSSSSGKRVAINASDDLIFYSDTGHAVKFENVDVGFSGLNITHADTAGELWFRALGGLECQLLIDSGRLTVISSTGANPAIHADGQIWIQGSMTTVDSTFLIQRTTDTGPLIDAWGATVFVLDGNKRFRVHPDGRVDARASTTSPALEVTQSDTGGPLALFSRGAAARSVKINSNAGVEIDHVAGVAGLNLSDAATGYLRARKTATGGLVSCPDAAGSGALRFTDGGVARLRSRNHGDTADGDMAATAFVVVSSRTLKSDDAPLDGAAMLDALRRWPMRVYRHDYDHADNGHRGREVRFGGFAEEAPDVIADVVPGELPSVSLGDWLAAATAALTHLAEKVDANVARLGVVDDRLTALEQALPGGITRPR